jgi:galactonate dehydratase
MRITAVTPFICQGGDKNWTLVKVETDAGITGWGDATEWLRVHGHVGIIVNDLAPLVIGEDPFDIERLWQRMWVASYVGGKDLNVAITGIETALWDILGKALNTPVYTLLGGRCHERVRLYYDYCDAYGAGFRGGLRWHAGDSSLEGVVRQARWIKDQGFTALKMAPVGLSARPAVTRIASLEAIDATAAKVRAVREAVGDGVDIALDLTARLDLPSAMAMAQALEPYRLLFLEDPLRQDESPASYKRLTEATRTPIGTGENLYTSWSFRNYLEIGALDVVLPDVCHAGVLQTKKIAALAEAFHLPVAPHNPNSPLSAVISAHVCSTIPNLLALEMYASEGEPPWRDAITDPPVSSLVRDGYLTVPTGPGWGVAINEEELGRHPFREVWYSQVGKDWKELDLTPPVS